MIRYESKNVKLGQAFRIGAAKEEAQKAQAQVEAEQIIEDGKKRAQEIINAAQKEKEQILNEASTQAQKILDDANEKVEEAVKEGIEEGRKEGFEQITNEMQDKVLMIDDFAKVTFDLKKKIIKSAHTNIIQLIMEISKKLALDEVEDEKILEKLVLNGIAQLPEKEAVTIMINPKLAAKIYAISEGLKEKVQQLNNIRIIEDPSVSPDGPIVEGVSARVDARVLTQIEVFESRLKEYLYSMPEDTLVEMSEQDSGVKKPDADI